MAHKAEHADWTDKSHWGVDCCLHCSRRISLFSVFPDFMFSFLSFDFCPISRQHQRMDHRPEKLRSVNKGKVSMDDFPLRQGYREEAENSLTLTFE